MLVMKVVVVSWPVNWMVMNKGLNEWISGFVSDLGEFSPDLRIGKLYNV